MKLTQTRSSSQVGIGQVGIGQVGIVYENAADRIGFQDTRAALKQFGISSEFVAFRAGFDKGLRVSRWKVLIVGSLPLASRLAKMAEIPVVLVPRARGRTRAEALVRKALLRPNGAGIACVAVNAGFNAGLLAAQMIGIGEDPRILSRIRRYKQDLRRMVLRKKI